MSGRIVGHTAPHPIHVCDAPSMARMPTAYQQGTIWQCDCGKTYKAIVVVLDYHGEYMTISWNSEGWIARHRRERAADRVAPPIPCDPTPDDVPPPDFDG